MSDEEWVSFGRHLDDEAYYEEFESHFGLDIHPNSVGEKKVFGVS
jgi:hypothetical protein